MNNIHLNPGGVIGAVLLGAVVIAAVVLTSSPGSNVGSRVGQFGVVAVFVGAFGGNYLWDRLFPKSK